MSKKRTYAILTTDSNRIEVQAYNVDDAYRQASKKIKNHIKELKKAEKIGGRTYEIMQQWISEDSGLTKAYMTFGRDGFNKSGFIITQSSIKAFEKYSVMRWK